MTTQAHKPTARQRKHAERILSYGKDRAAALLWYARTFGVWSHVDWSEVERRVKENA